MTIFDGCRDSLVRLSPAVSGHGGDRATFRAASDCVRHGLSDADAMVSLRKWNATHCKPPWTESELARKLKNARRAAERRSPRLAQPLPSVRVEWKIERKTPPAMPAPTAKPTPPKPIVLAKPTEPAEKIWSLLPGAPIPARFVDVLATWNAFRNHPSWKDHPQLKREHPDPSSGDRVSI